MAKIEAFKFVSVGALKASSFPSVRASIAPLEAVNGIGKTVEGIGNVVSDITSIQKGTLKAYAKIAERQRRELRLQRDAAAEARQERASAKLKSTRKKLGKKKRKKLNLGNLILNKIKDIAVKAIAPIIGPLSAWSGMIIGVLAARGAFDLLTDEEKRKQFVETFEKAKCVFGKIFGFIKDRIENVWNGWQKLTGEDQNLIDRLTGLGEVLTGIAGLLLAFNPLGILGFLFDTLAGIGNDPDAKKKKQPDADEPDGKKKTPDADVDADGKAKRPTGVDDVLEGNVPDAKPKRGNFLTRFVDDRLADAARLRDRLMKAASDKWGLVDNWAKTAYANLSEAARKQWENMVNLSKKLADKSKQIGNAVKNKVGDAAKFVKEGVGSLAAKAKQAATDMILIPLKKLMDPVVSKLKSIAGKIMDPLFNTPIGKKVLEALKKKGVSGADDFMGIAKRVGGKALPVVGGLVNMLFAYDRFAQGDPFGGLLEALSAGFDLSTIFGFVPGAGISMGIDAYMFARDLVPGIQEFEEKMLNKIPGAKQIGDAMKSIGNMLPDLGQIVQAIAGKKAVEGLPEKASGGKVALYAGHADMLPSDPSGAFGTAGGNITGGKYSTGLPASAGGVSEGFVPAAKQAGYLSNEAYFNDMIAKKAAAKSGGAAVYRKPIRTRSGSDPKGNWKRIDADNAKGITTIEIHQDAPSPMGRPGTMGVSPSMASRGAKNPILKAVNTAYGIHSAQRGLGAVNSNNLSTLLEIDALNMKHLKNPGAFIEAQSSKLAAAIKAGAKGMTGPVADAIDIEDDGSGDYSGDSYSGDETAVDSTPAVPQFKNPLEAFTEIAKKLFPDLDLSEEQKPSAPDLSSAFTMDASKLSGVFSDASVIGKYDFSKEFSIMKDNEVMPFPVLIDTATPVFIPQAINTDKQLIYASESPFFNK